jgi:hypoxanthine phosphoribosyltransferase
VIRIRKAPSRRSSRRPGPAGVVAVSQVSRPSGPSTAPTARLRVIFTESQIQSRVAEMADRVSRDYHNRTLHLVGLLENSFVFLSDFTRLLHVKLVCHFLRVTMKDRSWHGLPLREITFTPNIPVRGKNVLLVDGVLQTGVTLDFLIHSIQDQEPSSLRTAALIEKTTQRKIGVKPDYVGFRTRKEFLVGYGLGLEGEYMNLPYLAEIEGC